jgi:hypothetical protein
MSSGLWRHVVLRKYTNISEELVASIFAVIQKTSTWIFADVITSYFVSIYVDGQHFPEKGSGSWKWDCHWIEKWMIFDSLVG